MEVFLDPSKKDTQRPPRNDSNKGRPKRKFGGKPNGFGNSRNGNDNRRSGGFGKDSRNNSNNRKSGGFGQSSRSDSDDRRWWVIFVNIDSLDEMSNIVGESAITYFPNLFNAVRTSSFVAFRLSASTVTSIP